MRELDDAELEAALRDVGARLAYPRTTALEARVRAHIAERERPRRGWLFALAPAAVTLLVLAAGAAAAEVIRLRGIEIFRGPVPVATPSAAASPLIPGARRVGSVAEAAQLLGFRPLVPAALGAPDEVLIAMPPGGTAQAVLVYRGAALTQVRGATVEAPILGKVAGPDTRIQELTVNGGRGVWLEGAPHQVFYREANGNIVQDTLRLAGNVLLWEQGGLLLRLEAQVPRERALAIAASLR